jgi:hypothetical protein
MKKLLLFINTFLFAWEMQGFTAPTTPPNTKTWCYQQIWKNNFNYGNFEQIIKIEGGEACWTYEKINLNLEKKDTYNWHEAWNFVTPIFKNWNLDEKFKGHALVAWKYQNKKWKIYYKKYKITKLENFNNLNIGEGMFVYIPEIDVKINNQPLFCKDGNCSEIITTNRNYKFYLKAPQNKEIKFAFDLYRYSNNTHYKLAIGPFKISNSKINGNIPVCVEKEESGGSCTNINNDNEKILSYNNGYLSIDAQKIANHFNKSIPNTSEKFKVKFYIENFDLPDFTNEKFGTLGMEGFGTWVNLDNSKKVEFEMELK